MTVEEEFALAKVEADEARAALTGTLVDIQARINPRALARDALDELRDAGTDIARKIMVAARRNPAPLIGIGATVIGIFAKDWIIDAFAARAHDATGSPPLRSPTEDGMPMPEEGSNND